MDTPSREALLCSIAATLGHHLTRFFASQVPDAAEAQDLVQEVYLRLLKLERPDFIRSPRAYVYTIAANIAYEYRLKRASRPVHIALDDALADSLPADDDAFGTSAPESAACSLERVAVLVALLSDLSPKVRAALIWAHRDGYTYEEIATRLSVSRIRVKKYLARALAQCRKNVALEGAAG